MFSKQLLQKVLRKKTLPKLSYRIAVSGSFLLICSTDAEDVNYFFFFKCGVLLNLVSFVEFKKREERQWMSVTFSEACNFTKSNTPPWAFFTFLKFYK